MVSIMKRKAEKKRLRFKILAIWFSLMSIFFVELLIYTWCRVQCVRIGYEMTKEADHYRSVTTWQNNLKVEIAHLKSPERLASIAKHQLHLAIPTPEQMIIIP